MMICMCSLAGTAACKTCRNNPDSVGQFNTFVTGTTTVTDTPQITYVPERTCRNVDDEFPYFKCSECGCNAVVGYGSSGDGLPNYCPNCGARVIGANE